MRRLLTPSLNSAGLVAAANALYAITEVILAHYHVAWGLSPAQIATLDGFALAWIRTQVTPIADPNVPGKVITDLASDTAQAGPKPGSLTLTRDELTAVERVLAGAQVQPLWTIGPGTTTATAPFGTDQLGRPFASADEAQRWSAAQSPPPDVHDQPPPPGA